MTVQQLINRLRSLPPTLSVIMPAEADGDFCVVDQAFVDTVQFKDGVAVLADERESEWLEVVRPFGPDDL